MFQKVFPIPSRLRVIRMGDDVLVRLRLRRIRDAESVADDKLALWADGNNTPPSFSWFSGLVPRGSVILDPSLPHPTIPQPPHHGESTKSLVIICHGAV